MERCLMRNLLSTLCSRVCGVSFALEKSALCWPSLSTTCLFFLVIWGNGLRSELCFHEVFALCWPMSSPRVASEATQSCLTLCNPMDCRLPDSSVHGIFQARVLEWVAISFSRGSSRPRDWTWVSCIAGRCFTIWATGEATSPGVTLYVWSHAHWTLEPTGPCSSASGLDHSLSGRHHHCAASGLKRALDKVPRSCPPGYPWPPLTADWHTQRTMSEGPASVRRGNRRPGSKARAWTFSTT